MDQEHCRAADKAALRTRRIDIRSAPAHGGPLRPYSKTDRDAASCTHPRAPEAQDVQTLREVCSRQNMPGEAKRHLRGRDMSRLRKTDQISISP